MSKCKYCAPPARRVLLELGPSLLVLPSNPHVSPDEGGHLVCIPRRHQANRLTFTPDEAVSLHYLSVFAARILQTVCGAAWWNFQENGNWTLPDVDEVHAHIHVYGRAVDAREQPFGEALNFPDRDEIEDWDVDDYEMPQVIAMFEETRKWRERPEFSAASTLLREIGGPVSD